MELSKILGLAVFSAFRNTLSLGFFLTLIASNIFLVTSSKFHSMATALVESLPINSLLDDSPSKKTKKLEAENRKLRNENQRLVSEKKVRAQKLVRAKQVSRRIAQRTARNVASDLTTMVGEATPYLGIGLVVASTALDAKDGCDTMKDVNEILAALEDEQEPEDSNQVCGIKIPTMEELTLSIKDTIGGTLHQSEENVRQSAKELYDALGGTTYHSKERVQGGSRKFYDALGGTLYEIFN